MELLSYEEVKREIIAEVMSRKVIHDDLEQDFYLRFPDEEKPFLLRTYNRFLQDYRQSKLEVNVTLHFSGAETTEERVAAATKILDRFPPAVVEGKVLILEKYVINDF